MDATSTSPDIPGALEKIQYFLRLNQETAVREIGLTVPQCAALAALAQQSGLTAAALARRCFVTPQTMTGIVANLVTAGLIVREADPDDVGELWLKLAIHEMAAAIAFLRHDQVWQVRKVLARCKSVLRQLIEQWAVLETMTPSEYLEFRETLGPSSGFQSLQYRVMEFVLGNKNAAMLKVFDHDPAGQAQLRAVLEAPSLYDEFLRYLARFDHAVPVKHLERDWSEPHVADAALLPVF